MITAMATAAVEREASPEEQLWRTVISMTIQEWLSGPMRRRREAEQYLFQDNIDFPAVCQSAGMDASNLRARLVRLRTQAEREDQVQAAACEAQPIAA